MAKKEDVVITPMTKKQKILNALKIVGICFGAAVGVIAAVVLYVWISGGFNPPYVPLTRMNFSKNEYVISELDTISLVPNDGCTELDNVTLTIEDTNIVALVEDDYTTAIKDETDNEEGEPEVQTVDEIVTNKYFVTIGQNIQITPIKQTINAGTPDEKQVNVGGWVKLVAERGLIHTDCWVFVDVPVESLDLVVNDDLEEVEPEQGQEEQSQTYVVYPNSTFQLGVTNQQPLKSFVLPKNPLPYGKSQTSYMGEKEIVYVSSDETLATVNSKTGVVTVAKDAEGSFSIYAYVIAEYNNLNNQPDYQEYVDKYGPIEGPKNWEQDFDKIRVKTQTISFTIKDNVVENISVAKNKLTYNLLANNIILDINPKNTNSNYIDAEHNNMYHYGLDLQLSLESNIKNDLYYDIELFSGYTTNDNTNAVFINDKWVVLDDSYFKITKIKDTLSWNIVVNEYRANGNVLVFGYPVKDAEGNISDYIYDYADVEIKKVAIDGLSFNNVSKEINLSWTEDNVQTKNLSNTVTVNPSNATYNKSEFIKYFALADNGVIEVDSSIKIKTIDGKEYCAICRTDDEGNKNYNFINPLSVGNKISVVAVVLIYDANNELILQDGYCKFDYIGNLNDSITVSVEKSIVVTSVDVKKGDTSILNKESNYVEISKGDTFVVEITCDEHIVSDTIFTWAEESDTRDLLSQINTVSIEDNKLIYTLTANKDGSLTLYIVDANGNKVSNDINIEILNTELQSLSLTSNASNGVSVKLTNSVLNEMGNFVANGYEWKVLDENGNLTDKDVTFNIVYTPDNTINKTFTVAAYQYLKDYTEEELAELKPEDLMQYKSDIFTFEENYNGVKTITPIINKPGKAIVFAVSLSGDIVSNPIVIEISIPDIRVEFSDGNLQQIVAVDGLSKSLISYEESDNKEGNKFRIGVYTKTTDLSINNAKTYYVLEQDEYVQVATPTGLDINSYYEFTDISALVDYKFAGNYTTEDDIVLTSQSGIKIDNLADTLILCDIDSNLQEVIVMYTKFGFESSPSQSFVYNLVADYKVETNSGEYYAPSVVDIFADGSVKFTNKAGNILYLPEGYDISNLTAEYLKPFFAKVESPINDDISNYYENIYGEYSKTNDLSIDNAKTYYILNVKYNLVLNSMSATYCSTEVGSVKLFRIPEQESITVSVLIAVLKEDGTTGYSEQLLFTILPGVASNFEANGPNGDSSVLVVDTTIIENQGQYQFTNDTNVVDLSTKLNFNNFNDSVIEVTGIEFSSGYISLVGVDALNGDKIVKYELTTDTEIDNNKSYYVKTINGYELVENPQQVDIGTYYVVTDTYVLTTDTEIDNDKSYYVKTINGYELVENPQQADIGTYYVVTDAYAELDTETNTLSLTNKLLENNISDFEIKLKVEVKVQKDDVTAKLTSYYFVRFELPKGN